MEDHNTIRKPIIISPELQLVGVWMSVAKLLAFKYPVLIVARGTGGYERMKSLIGDAPVQLEIIEEFIEKLGVMNFSDERVIKEVKEREIKYGEFFSMLLSQDRGLGKGYLFNADRHPNIVKAWWLHEKKLKELLKEFLFWEYIHEKYQAPFILTTLIGKVMALVSHYHHVKTLALWPVRYGNRQFWMENEYNQNETLIKKVKENIQKYIGLDSFDPVEYVLETGADYLIKQERYSFCAALKRAIMIFYKDIRKVVTGHYQKYPTYTFLSWMPVTLRRHFMYKYFLKHGKHPANLKKYRLVLFPLHLEPEVALLVTSPEFNNSMEAIAWVSKSLPADTLLVVKEQPNCFGIRSKHYYDNLRRIGNVVLAHPEHSSWEWIKQAEMITTIAGTAGIEAVYFNKPVLSFGKHQLINHLPTVRYANNFDLTRVAVNELLSLSKGDRLLDVSKRALYDAQMDISFEVEGLESIYKSFDLQEKIAQVVVEELEKFYPVN